MYKEDSKKLSQTLSEIRAWLSQQVKLQKVWLAFSGGLDSCVLLSILCRLKESFAFDLGIVHVNHGLSPTADQWQAFAKACALQKGIHFQAFFVQITSKKNLEAQARQKRYDCFAKLINKQDVLFMAHHADDQNETFFLRAIRGSSVHGLTGIPQQRPLNAGVLFRPLLHWTRAELAQYAKANHLVWQEDLSNQSTLYDRNFLRSHVLPPLAGRWPQFASGIEHTVKFAGQAQALIQGVAQTKIVNLTQDFFESDLFKQSIASEMLASLPSINLALFQDYQPPLSHWVFIEWLRLHGTELPSRAEIGDLIHQLQAAEDRQPNFRWQSAIFYRYAGRLFLLAQEVSPSFQKPNYRKVSFSNLKEGVVSGGFLCQLGFEANRGVDPRVGKRCLDQTVAQLEQLFAQGQLWIGGRLEGGRFKELPSFLAENALKKTQSHRVKKLYQAEGIPPWWRDAWPCLYLLPKEHAWQADKAELIAIGGLFRGCFAEKQLFLDIHLV